MMTRHSLNFSFISSLSSWPSHAGSEGGERGLSVCASDWFWLSVSNLLMTHMYYVVVVWIYLIVFLFVCLLSPLLLCVCMREGGGRATHTHTHTKREMKK